MLRLAALPCQGFSLLSVAVERFSFVWLLFEVDTCCLVYVCCSTHASRAQRLLETASAGVVILWLNDKQLLHVTGRDSQAKQGWQLPPGRRLLATALQYLRVVQPTTDHRSICCKPLCYKQGHSICCWIDNSAPTLQPAAHPTS